MQSEKIPTFGKFVLDSFFLISLMRDKFCSQFCIFKFLKPRLFCFLLFCSKMQTQMFAPRKMLTVGKMLVFAWLVWFQLPSTLVPFTLPQRWILFSPVSMHLPSRLDRDEMSIRYVGLD